MARVSTSHHLEELVREARVLSSIKADIPHAWKILEDEINRARAAIAHSVEQPPSSSIHTSSSSPDLACVDPSSTAGATVTSNPPVPTSSSSSVQISNQQNQTVSSSGPHAVNTSAGANTASSSLPASSGQNASSAVATAAAVAAVNAFADASHPPPAAAPRHPIRKRVKLRVPAEQYPDYNFVGRLLGPRGATLKRLERDTACRIMIRGKGSIRKDKEAEVRGKPGYEHVFHEPLHVVIEVADATDDVSATETLNQAKDLVEMLLVPVPEERDSLKRAQLRDLAILNGTHRSASDLIGPPAPTLHHHLSTLGSGNPARSPPLASSPPPLRRAHSTLATPTPPMYNSSDPYAAAFDQTSSFGRLGSNSGAPSGPSLSSTAFGVGASGFNSNPSASADSFLPDLSKLRIPTLDLDTLNEPTLSSSPLPLPSASPTLVDPEFYPYLPTPGVLSVDQSPLSAFASPMWSTRGTAAGGGPGLTSGGLPPRSPPPPSGSLPPRSPPPPPSGPGAVGDGNANGSSSIGSTASHGAASFFLARQFGDHAGRGFSTRDVHQRDGSSFDAAFGSAHLSSGHLNEDDLGSITTHLSRGGSRMGGTPVGSPPPASPPPLSRARSLGAHHFGHMHQGSTQAQVDQNVENLKQAHEQQAKQTTGSLHMNGRHQPFASSDSIILSNLFPVTSSSSQSYGDGNGDHVSLRLHPAHGKTMPLTSESSTPSSSTCQ